MNLQMLRLTGEPRFAEEIERSAYNHLLAAQKPGGEDWVYYTPLEGRKQYDAYTTCCHSSGPRGIALLPEAAAMMSDDDGIVINLYNTGVISTTLKSGKVTIDELTAYPIEGTVKFTVTPERNGAMFPLRLRIPSWCTESVLRINGRAVRAEPISGAYATVSRRWNRGDTVTLELKISARLAFGDHVNEGKAAVLFGPLVLALDAALNPNIGNPARAELATEDGRKLSLRAMAAKESGDTVFVTDGKLAGSQGAVPLYLTPYATAGQDGKSRFEVWIARPGKGVPLMAGSLFDGARTTTSRQGNQIGDINDGDTTSLLVTFDGKPAAEDWYALVRDTPVEINRVVFVHGRSFHDGGWFDTSAGKPRIQVRTEKSGEWTTVATLDSYPNTTAANSGGLHDGQKFETRFPAISAAAIRIVGKPASGDNAAQTFSSCAELQAFLDR